MTKNPELTGTGIKDQHLTGTGIKNVTWPGPGQLKIANPGTGFPVPGILVDYCSRSAKYVWNVSVVLYGTVKRFLGTTYNLGFLRGGVA